jgi:hypothetical protein
MTMLTAFQAETLLHGMASRGPLVGEYATLAELLADWSKFGVRLLADWPGRRPPITPQYTDVERQWRKQNAARLGFPLDGSAGPPDLWEVDPRPFAQMVADYLLAHPGRRAELERLWSATSDPHARRLAIWRMIFGGSGVTAAQK